MIRWQFSIFNSTFYFLLVFNHQKMLFLLFSSIYLIILNSYFVNSTENPFENGKVSRDFVPIVIKEVIALVGSELGPNEKEFLLMTPKILNSDDTNATSKWLENVADGILCSEKLRQNQNVPKPESEARTELSEILIQFCSNFQNGVSILEATNGLENRMKEMIMEIEKEPEIQKKIYEAKMRSKITKLDQNGRIQRIEDWGYLVFEEFVKQLKGHVNNRKTRNKRGFVYQDIAFVPCTRWAQTVCGQLLILTIGHLLSFIRATNLAALVLLACISIAFVIYFCINCILSPPVCPLP